MAQSIKRLGRNEWDFSRLVGRDRGPDRKKGQKKSEEDMLRQMAVLQWELSRAAGSGQRPWLDLLPEEQKYRPKLPLISVSEVSAADFARFLSDYRGVPAPRWLSQLNDPYDSPSLFPSNPITEGDTPHVLIVRWQDFGVEEIIPKLVKWARAAAKKPGRKKRRRSDPMSDLWSLAAFRLHEAGHTYAGVAEKLNGLPTFRDKRTRFDAEGARKLAAEGGRLVRDAKLSQIWSEYLMACAIGSEASRTRPTDRKE